MMPLHDLTLLFVVAVVGAVNAVVFAWGALLSRSTAPWLWAAGSLCLGAAASSSFFTPDPLSAQRALGFNLPAVLGHAFWLAGTLQFCGFRGFARWLLPLTAAALATVLWLTLVDPDRGLRIALAAGTAACLRFVGAYALLRARGEHDRRVAWAAALALLLEGLALVDHALAGLRGLVPSIGTDGEGQRWLTWFSMLMVMVVSMPLMMLLALTRILSQLRRLADQDPLTQLPNRRGFFHRIEPMLAHARRQQQGAAVLMLDVDHFKKLNDRFGHGVGDQVLRAMGATLRAVLRGSDTAVRWGGEEFCALLVATDGKGAHIGAERIRTEFTRRCGEIPALGKTRVTVSIGIAYGRIQQVGFEALQQLADQALYAAKDSGRDRAVFAEAEGGAVEA